MAGAVRPARQPVTDCGPRAPALVLAALRGSPLVDEGRKDEAALAHDHALLLTASDPPLLPPGARALSDLKWALAVVNSRAFAHDHGQPPSPPQGAGPGGLEGGGGGGAAEGDAAPIAIRLEEGLRTTGVVRFADGSPASSIVVTLRDRSGRMLPPTRTCVSANDGSFSFAGLDDSMRWVAFASMTRDGKTFSAQFVARGGGDPIVLEDEDPKLIREDR